MLARTGFDNGALVHASIDFVLRAFLAAAIGYQPYMGLFTGLYKRIVKRMYV